MCALVEGLARVKRHRLKYIHQAKELDLRPSLQQARGFQRQLAPGRPAEQGAAPALDRARDVVGVLPGQRGQIIATPALLGVDVTDESIHRP